MSSTTSDPSALTLAALSAIAVPGLDPARLALPQAESASVRVVGVIDTLGRHWEVIQARREATGAALEAEAEVLRRIGEVNDDGRITFDVPRPAGTLRTDTVHIQVRSHIEGRALDTSALHPGPGLSSGLGRALGELHELPASVVSDAGLPVYDAQEVRARWQRLVDEATETGRVPAPLLVRWTEALKDTALWRFRPVVVHGDLDTENILTAAGSVVAFRGLAQAHVGDPAEDMAWVYASVPVDCLDSIEGAYDMARSEGVDKHLRDRAELVSELSLARWLLHGTRSGRQQVIDDAESMLADLVEQVGQEPLVERIEPRLAPVAGERVTSSPNAPTSEVTMVVVSQDAHLVESQDEDTATPPSPGPGSADESVADQEEEESHQA